jgi:hypothetical protein
MRRAFFVGCILSLVAANSVAAELIIEATSDGVRVKGDRFTATAKRISFDESKGLLMLVGDKDAPAQLVRTSGGQESKTAAREISYWPKVERIKVEGFHALDTRPEAKN